MIFGFAFEVGLCSSDVVGGRGGVWAWGVDFCGFWFRGIV